MINNDFSAFDASGLTALTSLKELRVNGNKFEFEDLTPLLGIASSVFVYAPQQKIGTASSQTLSVGDALNLSVTIAGTNTYQWHRGLPTIVGATSNPYADASIDLTEAGDYSCKIRNTLLPLLTLQSEAVTVTVVTGPSTFPDWYITSENGKNVIIIDQPAVDTPAVVSATIWVEEFATGSFDYVVITPALIDFTDAVPPGGDENKLTDASSISAQRPYKYKIMLKDADGLYSDLSAMQQSIHLTINEGLGTTRNLLWTSYLGRDVDYYEVYGADALVDLGTETGTGALLGIVASSVNSFTDMGPGPAPDGYDYYMITAVFVGSPEPLKSGGIKASNSNIFSINGGFTNSIIPTLKVYPNPVIDEAKLVFDNAANDEFTLVVMDVTGKEYRYQENVTGTEISFSRGDLPPGIYIVQLRGARVMNTKMVIN